MFNKKRISLSCPQCGYTYIDSKTHYEVENKLDNNERKFLKRKKIYECRCPKCNKEFDMSYSEVYKIYNEPFFVMDYFICASYETELDSYNYKLIKLSNTGYDLNKTDDSYIYLLISDRIDAPILITKKTADDIMCELNNLYDNGIETDKAYKLVHNTHMTRIR